MRKQQPGESFDTYITALRSLANDCNCKVVAADVYQQESVRDAFIAGTSSQTVRQRLLEKRNMSLDEMIDLARSLESAEVQAESYRSSPTSAAVKRAESDPPAVSKNNSCWNCGNPKH